MGLGGQNLALSGQNLALSGQNLGLVGQNLGQFVGHRAVQHALARRAIDMDIASEYSSAYSSRPVPIGIFMFYIDN